MKKTAMLLGISAIVLNSSVLFALPTITTQGGPFQAGYGGEFTLTVNSSDNAKLPVGSQFQTFCLEYNEHLRFGRTYYVELNTETILGGVGGGPNDPLDFRTAWLYNEFCNETLTGYQFNGTDAQRRSTAGSLQKAIWYLEEEITGVGSDTLAQSFIDLANTNHTGSLGDVRVLNLWKYANGTGYAQDLLCKTVPVPAPGAILLGSIGASLVGALRKKYMV